MRSKACSFIITSLLSRPVFIRSWPMPLELVSSCSATSQLMVAMARSRLCSSLEPRSIVSEAVSNAASGTAFATALGEAFDMGHALGARSWRTLSAKPLLDLAQDGFQFLLQR